MRGAVLHRPYDVRLGELSDGIGADSVLECVGAHRANSGGLPRDGRAPRDQDAAAPVGCSSTTFTNSLAIPRQGRERDTA